MLPLRAWQQIAVGNTAVTDNGIAAARAKQPRIRSARRGFGITVFLTPGVRQSTKQGESCGVTPGRLAWSLTTLQEKLILASLSDSEFFS
jgi:hypothetical protein